VQRFHGLNAGQALPTMTQALIFIATVSVDLTTLVSMILAAVLGAWLGVGLVARLSRRAIQLGMGDRSARRRQPKEGDC
jgi:uncharacterized membrane protein YfcA